MNFDEAFKILEIEPTDDKKKIKIAYSKILKEYHPEEFPEMFMKIREAYQTALKFEKYNFDEVKYKIKRILKIEIFLKLKKILKIMIMRRFFLKMIFKIQILRMKNFLMFLVENMNGWKKI